MKDAFDLLRQVDSLIHHEVQKMMPGAELPQDKNHGRRAESVDRGLPVDSLPRRRGGWPDCRMCRAYGNGIDIQREDPQVMLEAPLRFVLTRH